MMFGLIFLTLIYVNLSMQDCVIDNRSPQNAWEHKLLKDLKAKPEILEKPCGRDGVEANVKLVLKWFKYDSNEGMFMIYSWVFLSWNNPGLIWNPADYGGLNDSVIQNDYMWYPQLKLINVYPDEQMHYFIEPCKISSYGKVVCIYRLVQTAICNSDLTKWPYDSQSCSLKIGVTEGQNGTVRLKSTGRVISMIGAEYGGEFDIMDYKQEENQGADVQLKITFIIERHAEILAAILIYPSTALCILSITSFALDVRRMIRFGLICFNVAVHFSFLMELHELIPGHSFYPPTILYYFRGSMLINIFLVLFTYILGVMCKRQKVPPVWITFVNDSVFKSRGKAFVWPRWDSEEGINEFSEQWTNFANVINNIFFVVIVIAYVCMYFVYIPQPPPWEY